METISVQAILSAKDKGYTSSMQKAADIASDFEKQADRAATSVGDIAKGTVAGNLVVSMFNKITSSVGDAVKRLDTLNNYPKVMTSLGYSAEEAQSSIDLLSNGIEGLPTTLDSIVGSAQILTASLGDLDAGTKTAIALNDMFLAGGQGAEAASRALTQYNQVLAKGKVDMESWNTIVEVAPGQMNQLAQSLLGASAGQKDLYEALQAGKISVEEMNNAVVMLDQQGGAGFASFAEQAQAATGGIGTAFTNIQSAITKGVANIISSIDQSAQAAGLPGISEALAGVKQAINDFFAVAANVAGQITSTVAPVFKFLGENIDVVAAAAVTLASGFVALKVVNTVTKQIDKLKTSSKNAADICLKYKEALDKYSSAAKASETATKLRKDELTAQSAAEKLCKKQTESLEKAEKLEAKAAELSSKAKKDGTTNTKQLTQAEKLLEKAKEARTDADKKATQAQNAETLAKKKGTQATQAEAAAETLSNTQISAKSVLLGVLSGKIKIAEAAQIAWNAAMSANPIGAVITIVTGLITVITSLATAFGGLSEEEKKAQEEQEAYRDEINETVSESQKLHEEIRNNADACDRAAQKTKDLADEVISLQSRIDSETKAGRDASDMKNELSAKTEELNAQCEDLSLTYDKETNSLNMSANAIRDKIDAYTDMVKAQAIEEDYKTLIEDELELEKKQSDAWNKKVEASKKATEAKKALSKAEQEYQIASQNGTAVLDPYINKMNEANEKYAAAKEQVDLAVEGYKQYSTELYNNGQLQKEHADLMAESAEREKAEQQSVVTNLSAAITEKAALLQQGLETQTATLDMLSAKNQETVAMLQETWQSYYDHATNMFSALSEEQTISVDEMIANVQKNQEVMNNWGNNMQDLRNRVEEMNIAEPVKEGLRQMLDSMQAAGPEQAGAIAALVAASDEQLVSLGEGWGTATDSAWNAMQNSNTEGAARNMEQVKNLVTQIGDSFSETVANTNWMEMSSDIVQGLAEGLGADDEAVEAAKQLAKDTYTGSELQFEIGSPSKVFDEQGRYNDQGLAQGMRNNSYVAENAAQSVAQNVINKMRQSLQSITNIGSWAMQGFVNGMESQRSSVMATASSIANSAANAISSALDIGSPSRLLKKFGAWGGEGFANGLESAKTLVLKAVNTLTQIPQGIRIGDIFDTGNMKFAFAGGMSIESDVTFGFDDLKTQFKELKEAIENRPIQLDNSFTIDGREFARSTATYTQSELDRRQTRNNRKNGYV